MKGDVYNSVDEGMRLTHITTKKNSDEIYVVSINFRSPIKKKLTINLVTILIKLMRNRKKEKTDIRGGMTDLPNY